MIGDVKVNRVLDHDALRKAVETNLLNIGVEYVVAVLSMRTLLTAFRASPPLRILWCSE